MSHKEDPLNQLLNINPEEQVDRRISNSPIYAHIQCLVLMHQRRKIDEKYAAAMIRHAEFHIDYLQKAIDQWNERIEKKVITPDDQSVITKALVKAALLNMVARIATTYGEDNKAANDEKRSQLEAYLEKYLPRIAADEFHVVEPPESLSGKQNLPIEILEYQDAIRRISMQTVMNLDDIKTFFEKYRSVAELLQRTSSEKGKGLAELQTEISSFDMILGDWEHDRQQAYIHLFTQLARFLSKSQSEKALLLSQLCDVLVRQPIFPGAEGAELDRKFNDLLIELQAHQDFYRNNNTAGTQSLQSLEAVMSLAITGLQHQRARLHYQQMQVPNELAQAKRYWDVYVQQRDSLLVDTLRREPESRSAKRSELEMVLADALPDWAKFFDEIGKDHTGLLARTIGGVHAAMNEGDRQALFYRDSLILELLDQPLFQGKLLLTEIFAKYQRYEQKIINEIRRIKSEEPETPQRERKLQNFAVLLEGVRYSASKFQTSSPQLPQVLYARRQFFDAYKSISI